MPDPQTYAMPEHIVNLRKALAWTLAEVQCYCTSYPCHECLGEGFAPTCDDDVRFWEALTALHMEVNAPSRNTDNTKETPDA